MHNCQQAQVKKNRFSVTFTLFVFAALIFVLNQGKSYAFTNDPGSLYQPRFVAGFSGNSDERDLDLYPSIAFDRSAKRFLTVWLSPRHAGSSTSGFDVYGIFLGLSGQPISNAFRISDNNTVARNSLPSVVAGENEFVVAWTKRGSACKVIVQRVITEYNQIDTVLVSGTEHIHSPNLTYNPVRQRYVSVYVSGDDYLPPTFFGAETSDCRNNPSSESHIEAVEFYFQGNTPVISNNLIISDISQGAFRPTVAFSEGLNQYLAVWEDRRSIVNEFGFKVYAQLLNGNLALSGSNIPLAAESNYANYDSTATWTPRPVVAGGNAQFQTAWFTREASGNSIIWSVIGRSVLSNGNPNTPFPIANMTFVESHVGQSPTGFLSIAYADSVQEYLIGFSSFMESIWGYLSFVLVQRVNDNDQLLNMDGSLQDEPTVGSSVDFTLDDRISIGIAAHTSNLPMADYIIAYSKHAPNQPSTDFDIWGTQMRIQSASIKNSFLPLVQK